VNFFYLCRLSIAFFYKLNSPESYIISMGNGLKNESDDDDDGLQPPQYMLEQLDWLWQQLVELRTTRLSFCHL